MKRFLLIFGVLFYFVLLGLPALAQLKNKINSVVIDAGHGGKDPGALGSQSREKDIVLKVALKTGKIIQDSMPDIKVVYTRKTDEFIELHKRAHIANESGADVFISIHCNSTKSAQAYGVETFVMGLHKSKDNLDVAKTENAAIYYEDDYKQQYEGFDPNTDEDYILLSMFQSANIDQGINLASKVQSQLVTPNKRLDRGVKQAGFWVLYKTTMPGILIELGFLSNPNEEKYLISDKGQSEMAFAIFNALKEFKLEFEESNLELKPIVKEVTKPVEKPKVYYRVQFASYKKEKTLDFKKFRGLPDIKMYEHDGQYKYTAGNDTSLQKANELKSEMLKQGFTDIFVIAFVDEKRISLEEARQLTEYKP